MEFMKSATHRNGARLHTPPLDLVGTPVLELDLKDRTQCRAEKLWPKFSTDSPSDNHMLQDYPWKKRLGPLLGASMLPWLALRPSYWPFASFGTDSDAVFFLGFLNRAVWCVVVVCTVLVLDLLMMRTAREIRDERQAKFKFPHLFWSGLLATLLAKTVVDFAFAGRALPAGRHEWFALERCGDLIALAAIPLVYLVAKRIGPPSNWPFVQALILQPPTTSK
jgi:hypothetical protein